MKFLKCALLFATLVVAGCTNSTKPSELPQFRVSDIQVAIAPGVKTNSNVSQTIKTAGRRLATAYSNEMPSNVPRKTVTVTIDRWHYKNPLASLLIGDGNSVNGRATVTNGPSGPFRYADSGSFAVNGILGAAIAAGSDKAKVDARLSAGVAEQALSVAYGQKGSTPKFVRDYLAGKRPARTEVKPVAIEQKPEPRVKRKRSGGSTPPSAGALSPTS